MLSFRSHLSLNFSLTSVELASALPNHFDLYYYTFVNGKVGFPGGSHGSLPSVRETWVQFLVREDSLEKEMATTPVFLPGKSYEQRSLAGYILWAAKS